MYIYCSQPIETVFQAEGQALDATRPPYQTSEFRVSFIYTYGSRSHRLPAFIVLSTVFYKHMAHEM
jgi:hypothetical protein